MGPSWTPQEFIEYIRNHCDNDPTLVEVKAEVDVFGGQPGQKSYITGRVVNIFTQGHGAWTIQLKDERGQFWTLLKWEDELCLEIVAVSQPVKRHAHGTCPKCGDAGEWRSLALVCRNGHGVFAG